MRASRVPLAMQCPASVTFDGDGTSSPAAALGTAIHRFCAGLASGRPDEISWWESRHPEHAKDIRILAGTAIKAWPEIRDWFPYLRIEKPIRRKLGGAIVTGTPDLLSRHYNGDDRTLVIGDWKTGWKNRDYSGQLLTYLWMARKATRYANYRTVVIWLRTGEVAVEAYTDEQVVAWGERLRDIVGNPEFIPGDHCFMCPGMSTCAAYRQMLTWPGLIENDIEITPEVVGMIYDRLSLIERRVDTVKSGIRAFVTANGAVALPRERVLRMKDEHREEIDVSLESLKILVDALGEHAGDALRASKTGIYAASRSAATSGKAVIESLRGANAITPKIVRKLVVEKDAEALAALSPPDPAAYNIHSLFELEGEDLPSLNPLGLNPEEGVS
jgi:hypothetical protein